MHPAGAGEGTQQCATLETKLSESEQRASAATSSAQELSEERSALMCKLSTAEAAHQEVRFVDGLRGERAEMNT
jgi:hypothetical protein